MLIPALFDLVDDNSDAFGFVGAAAVTLFTGVALALGFAGETLRISLRQGVLAVILTWIGAGLFGALPFLFAEQPLTLHRRDLRDHLRPERHRLDDLCRPRPGAARHPALALPADLAGRLRPGHLRGADPALSARRRPAAVHGRPVRPAWQVPAEDGRGRGPDRRCLRAAHPGLRGRLRCRRHVHVRCDRPRHGGDRHRRLLLARCRHRLLQEPGDRVDRDPVHAAGGDAVRAARPGLARQSRPAAQRIAGPPVPAGRGDGDRRSWRCGAWTAGPPRSSRRCARRRSTSSRSSARPASPRTTSTSGAASPRCCCCAPC